MTNGTPPASAGTKPEKKGLPLLAWLGIGCGGIAIAGLVIFVVVSLFVFKKGKEIVEEATGSESLQDLVENLKDNPAKVAAQAMIGANPELEMIETDDEAGTLTFRNTRTGEDATLDFEDIAEGRFSMTTDEGEYSVDTTDGGEAGVTFKGPEGETRFGASVDLEDIPDWVPAYPGASDTRHTMHSTTTNGVMGSFTSKTSDDAQAVVDRFKKMFENQGYEVRSESITKTGDGTFGALMGERVDEGRSINVVIMQNADECQITINYNQKKQ